MELIYILNVMIIINGKFNFTHRRQEVGREEKGKIFDFPSPRPQTCRVLNVIVKMRSEKRAETNF